jgi:hypothetical protein
VAADALAFNKQVYANNQPRVAAQDALTAQVVTDQLAISKQNQTQAADQWAKYQTLFAPVEAQTVADATNIDSAAGLAQASGSASAGVQTQFDNSAAQRARAQAANGVNPNSGHALEADSQAQLGLASAKAGASNSATLAARDRGISLRAGVANFGRNMPNTAANAYGVAMQGGNSAVGNQGSGLAAANSTIAGMNAGYGTSIQGNTSAMNGLNQQYSTQVNAWNAQQQADAASSAGLGSALGLLGSAAIGKFGSDPKIKENIKKVGEFNGFNVYAFTYKPEYQDEHGFGLRFGVMADEVEKVIPEAVSLHKDGYRMVNYAMLGA